MDGGEQEKGLRDDGEAFEMRLGVEVWVRVEETSEHCPWLKLVSRMGWIVLWFSTSLCLLLKSWSDGDVKEWVALRKYLFACFPLCASLCKLRQLFVAQNYFRLHRWSGIGWIDGVRAIDGSSRKHTLMRTWTLWSLILCVAFHPESDLFSFFSGIL